MHDKALTKEAKELLPLFGSFKEFYLVGGTALALQIGHRLSIDFDFFSEKPLPRNLLQKVKRVFNGYEISVTYQSPEQLNIVVNNVKITFFYYPYHVLYPLIEYKSIQIATISEIALMKAFSIGKRLSHKDYVDWYFLLSEHYVSLSEIIKDAQKKFHNDFNDRLFLGQLISMDDISEQKIDFLRHPVSPNIILDTLKKAVLAIGLQ